MRLVAIVRPALDALRDRRAMAFLLAATVAVGLIAVWPIGTVTTRALAPRLGLPALHADAASLDLGPDARSFTALQQDTLDQLFRVATVLAGLTLLSTLVTIAGQTAARDELRAPEIGVRRAVGASRRLLLAAALVELAALGGAALLAGGGLGAVAADLVAGSWPGPFLPGPMLRPFLLLAITVTLLVSGTWFVGMAPQRRVVEVPARPLPLILPALHCALAIMAVTTGSLLVRRSLELARPAASPVAGEVVAFTIDTSEEVRATRLALLIDTLRRNDYDTVGLTSAGTMAGLGPVAPTTTDCGVCYMGMIATPFRFVHATHFIVSPDSFRQLGIRLHEGRLLGPEDDRSARPVAVIDRALAFRHFQNGEALGRRIKIGPGEAWHTVVGVVDEPAPVGFGAGERPAFSIYLSALQHPPVAVELLVDRRHDAALEHAVAAASGTPFPGVRDARAVVTAESRPVRWFGGLYALEGAAILLLGLGGTVMQMILWVRSLRPELGLRRAAGATRTALLQDVARKGLRVAGAGIFLGAWFAPGVWSALAEMLPGLPGWEWIGLLVVSAIMAVVTVAAAIVPTALVLRQTPATLLQVES